MFRRPPNKRMMPERWVSYRKGVALNDDLEVLKNVKCLGMLSGAGQITTLNGENLIFNDPGVYTLLHAHKVHYSFPLKLDFF